MSQRLISQMQNRMCALRMFFLAGAVGAFALQSVPLRAAEPGSSPAQAGAELSRSETDSPPEPLESPAGKDGTGPAPSATDKQDRTDLLSRETALDDSVLRPELLQELYDQLRSAEDEAEAAPITEAIEEAWRNSGSDTIDLLMSRVDSFVLEADLDLALEVLDAVTEIAPDEAEAWHQRAIVNFMKQDSQRALADLRRALAIDPNHYKAMRDLGVVLQQTGDKKGALEAYRRALAVNPFLERARRAAEQLALEVEGRDI